MSLQVSQPVRDSQYILLDLGTTQRRQDSPTQTSVKISRAEEIFRENCLLLNVAEHRKPPRDECSRETECRRRSVAFERTDLNMVFLRLGAGPSSTAESSLRARLRVSIAGGSTSISHMSRTKRVTRSYLLSVVHGWVFSCWWSDLCHSVHVAISLAPVRLVLLFSSSVFKVEWMGGGE